MHKSEEELQCAHYNCENYFKTKKQKIMHHNKMTKECRLKKNLLIKQILRSKKVLLDVLKNKQGPHPHHDIFESDKDLIELKSTYDDTLKYMLDVEYFETIVGKSLEDLPTLL
jgi:hypothetical protein